jgi:hypothetical protein
MKITAVKAEAYNSITKALSAPYPSFKYLEIGDGVIGLRLASKVK